MLFQSKVLLYFYCQSCHIEIMFYYIFVQINRVSPLVLLLVLLAQDLGVLGQDWKEENKSFLAKGCSCTERVVRCPALDPRVSIEHGPWGAKVDCYRSTEPSDLVKYLNNSTILVNKREVNFMGCSGRQIKSVGNLVLGAEESIAAEPNTNDIDNKTLPNLMIFQSTFYLLLFRRV